MPRDVEIGEGYDGSKQIVAYTPGQHNGDYMMIRGESVLVPGQFVDMGVGDAPSQGFDSVGLDDSGNAVGVGDHFDRQDWAMGGMGDIAGSFASLIASKELEKLRSSLSGVQDQLRSLIEARKTIIDGYYAAKAGVEFATKNYGPLVYAGPFGMSIPNPYWIAPLTAKKTADTGVKVFARQLYQLELLYIVYRKIYEALSNAGATTDANMVSVSIQYIQRFAIESGSLMRSIPEYVKTRQDMQDAVKREWGYWKVSDTAYDQPNWFQAAVKALDKVVPLAAPKAGGGMTGMGIDPISLAIAIGVIIIAIGAATAVIVAVAKLTPDANFKMYATQDLFLAAQKRKQEAEAAIRADAARKGLSPGETQKAVDAANKSIDKDTGQQAKDLPDPPSAVMSLLGPMGLVVAAGIAFLAINK